MSYRGDNLIFIISQPKAGSTLLQRILAGHPDVQTSAETWLMLHPAYGLRRRGVTADYNAAWAAIGVQEFLDNYADGRETYNEGVRQFAKTIYGSVLERNGKRLFLDKTPRYSMIVSELHELFPEAKFILLIRNPLAILKSELHTYVKGNWPELGKFASDLVDAPDHLIAARKILANSAFEVRYEDLVSSPEDTVRSLCGFLGIDFDPGMLDYSETPAPKGRMNDPVGIHKHTGVSTGSLDRWKELGADAQTRHFALAYLDTLGGETVRGLGYDADALRQEIERTPVENQVRPLYPWSLALRQVRGRSVSDRVLSDYFVAAQAGGLGAGIAAGVRALFRRIGGGVKRMAGRDDSE